jgi:hypothetical protein
MKRILWQGAVAVAVVVGVALPATPAMAAYPYHECQYIGGMTPAVCTGWTGGYPGGKVRGESAANYFATKLLRCTACNGPTGWTWTTVASTKNYHTSTPSVTVGKTSWYKTCIQNVDGGPWSCMANDYAVYLGD